MTRTAHAVLYLNIEAMENHGFIRTAAAVLNTKTAEIARGLAHRPFDPAADAYRQFVKQLSAKIEAIEKEHPYIDFENEKRQCNTLLNR